MKTTQAFRVGWSIFAIAMVCSTSAGCRTSSWKMPGSNFFSWNREPDASKLAGNSTLPQYPESPATKHQPNAIASVGAGSADGKVASASSTNSTYGFPAQTVAAPKQGLAAQANGYQTGPYQVGEGAKSGSGSYPSSQPAGSALPNPYGGSYAGVSSTTSMPNVTLPSSVTDALNGGTANPPGTGSMAGYPTTSGSAGLPSYPSGTSRSQTSGGGTANQSLPSTPAYPPTGTASPTGNANSLPAYPSYPGSSGTSEGTPAAGSSSAHKTNSNTYSGTAASGNYAPGTTSRSTGYDFSGSSTGGAAQGESRLPPNTASETLPLLR